MDAVDTFNKGQSLVPTHKRAWGWGISVTWQLKHPRPAFHWLYSFCMTFSVVSCAGHKVFQNFISLSLRGYEKTVDVSEECRMFQRGQLWLFPVLTPHRVCPVLGGPVVSVLRDSFLSVIEGKPFHKLANNPRCIWPCSKAISGPIRLFSSEFKTGIVLGVFEGWAEWSWGGFGAKAVLLGHVYQRRQQSRVAPNGNHGIMHRRPSFFILLLNVPVLEREREAKTQRLWYYT